MPTGKKAAAPSRKSTPSQKAATPTPEKPTSLTNEDLRTSVNRQHLELVTEIRALTIQVSRLHTVFVKRTVLWWVLGVETAIVVAAIASVFVLSATNRSNTDHVVRQLVDSCQNRQAQVNGTNHFILDIEQLQQKAFKITPKQFLTPPQIKLQHDYATALNRWKRSQPKSFNCGKYKP